MSFLTPVKVPVKVYLSTDKDAPRLDRTPNCVATILKACLVTGYGDKQPAGWSLAFEDNPKGVKVLKPADSPHTPFMVRLSADTGREMTVQVYSEMSDIDAGELKLQCDTNFYYGLGQNSGKWAVIASPYGVWFLFEQRYGGEDKNKSGGYLFVGHSKANDVGVRGVLLKHSGGTWRDGAGYDVLSLDGRGAIKCKLFDVDVFDCYLTSFFDGKTKKTDTTLLSPIYTFANNKCYPMPAICATSTGASDNNFTRYQDKLIFGLSSYGEMTNFYFDCEHWEY